MPEQQLLNDLNDLANAFKKRWQNPKYHSNSQAKKQLQEAAESIWIQAEEELRQLISQYLNSLNEVGEKSVALGDRTTSDQLAIDNQEAGE